MSGDVFVLPKHGRRAKAVTFLFLVFRTHRDDETWKIIKACADRNPSRLSLARNRTEYTEEYKKELKFDEKTKETG